MINQDRSHWLELPYLLLSLLQSYFFWLGSYSPEHILRLFLEECKYPFFLELLLGSLFGLNCFGLGSLEVSYYSFLGFQFGL